MTGFKGLLFRQWPFWLGGLLVGVAEILFYARYDMFIVVTTGMAQMFAVPEELFFGWDGVAQAYEPGIHWVVVGAILGARIVAILEKESRAWVRFNPTMLIMAFIGGILFSFGTRLAAGCTTHHFIGGIASMSTASWAVLLTGIPFAFIAMNIVMGIGLGGFYRYQDNIQTAREFSKDSAQPCPGYDPAYLPWRNPVHIILTLFLILFIAIPLYYAIFTDRIAGSVSGIGWFNVLWMMGTGFLLGFGIAKSGYGTECAILAPHSHVFSHEECRRSGMPMASHAMLRGLLPLQGLMVSIVVFNLYILGAWFFGFGTIPNAAGEAGLYWGHLLGGPLLSMGAVFMIGCEVRTYARLGLGYGTALAALPGFYVGYLPYTFFQDSINDALLEQGLSPYQTLPQTAVALFGGGEAVWNVAYSLLMIGILVASFVVSRNYLGVNYKQLFSQNTDQVVQQSKWATTSTPPV